MNTVTGALVSAGAQAVSLADLSSLKLKVLISEVDIPSIAIGQKAVMVFDAYYNEPFTGEVLKCRRRRTASRRGELCGHNLHRAGRTL